MERKDKLWLLLLLGGGSYAAYANWEAIRDKLGLDDLSPGRIKAMELAKNSYDFERSTKNWQVVQQLAVNGDITVEGETWQAERQADDHWQVTCTYREERRERQFLFRVNISTGAVAFLGERPPAQPR